MRTTVTIRDDLYRQAKAAAAREGGSVGSVIEQALQAFLDRPVIETPPATLPVFEGLAPRPGIDFSRSSELLHDLDLVTP
jgi:hypothetical protein